MRSPRCGPLLAIVLGLGGCGGGDDDGDGLPLAEVEAAWAAVFCEQTLRCCDGEERAFFDQALGPAEECGEAWRQFVSEEKWLGDWAMIVASGEASYDAALGAACVDHLRSLSCADWSAFANEQNAAAGVACMTMFQLSCPPLEAAVCQRIAEGDACDPMCEDLYQCDGFCAGDLLCDPGSSTCVQSPSLEPPGFCDGA